MEPRTSRSADPRIPSLTCLGNEIISMIADLLQETSSETIPSLALVCSNYHRIARYSRYRMATTTIKPKS
ncbi:hypothetical protein F4819DRAFT_461213 [Hypoxylon fuscum]|nr:hypothetical protein F4819DRAFT_461213 [Hypoxylon fuscum]